MRCCYKSIVAILAHFVAEMSCQQYGALGGIVVHIPQGSQVKGKVGPSFSFVGFRKYFEISHEQ